MKTIFGVKVPSLFITDAERTIEIAFMNEVAVWKNPLAQLLPNDTPVVVIDGDDKGIKTIGDIKKIIQNQ